MHFRQLTLDEAMQQTVEVPEPPIQPVSKILIEQARKDQVVRHCPTCHHEERIYRRRLRPCFIPALRVLIEKGPMTTSQLFEYFADRSPLAAAITRHFGEVRHWRFAEQTEDGRWVPTERARAFLAGEIQVCRRVWPRDVELPEECEDCEPINVSDIKAEDWQDKQAHLRESVSLPPQP